MVSKNNIADLRERFNTLAKKARLEDKQIEADELRLRQQDPEFWDDADNAAKQSQKLKSLEKFLEGIRRVADAVEECELYSEENDSSLESDLEDAYQRALSELENYEFYNMLSNEGDNMSCAVKITAGAGGTEAQDWANMLLRMYLLYCQNQGFQTEITDYSEVSTGLVKTATILVEGENAYGLLKCETGVHRLVRVSPYNAQGKRMTSFASVFVTPIVDDTIEIILDKSKLSFDFFRSSGAGGQNINKVETGCRARYLYTDPDTGETEEIRVENTETRKQNDNRERALMILKSILYKKELDRRNAKKKELEDSKPEIGWGAQIRSYVFDDSRVKDHRTNYQENDVSSVMNGHLDGFIKAYLMSQF